MNSELVNNQIERFLLGMDITVPFSLTINNDVYSCTEVLRLLPSKRLVVKAEKNDKRVVIKLFSNAKKGRRELARERHGHQLAKKAGVNVPELEFITEDVQNCSAIAYAYLENAKPFANKKKTLAVHIDNLLNLVATLHSSGVYQDDFHLGNVLIVDNDLYLIDLASVEGESQSQALNKHTSLSNLALLIVQFKPKQQQDLIQRLKNYYQDRGWAFNREEQSKFSVYIDKAWQKRKTLYLSKRFRNCTMTAYKKTFNQEYGFHRSFLESVGDDFIREIDELILKGTVIKAGNSATVVQVDYAGKKLVIKRYNIKNFWHFLKRCYRPSRAAISWRNGNLLQLLGIPTPKPLGFIEKRFGFFRKAAYLICERSNGQELSTVFNEARLPSEKDLSKLKNIFSTLKNYQISHGDMKATNLLLKKKGKIVLLDLDSMQEHTNTKEAEIAFNKDKVRFLRNWQDLGIRSKFESLF